MKIAIIGGGAAGFFCAANLNALAEKHEVHIFEKTKKLLSKVLVSGGGRCNVTNAEASTSAFIDHYPRGRKELKSVFTRFSNRDTVNWFADRGVRLHAEEDGRMFPETNQSQTIVNCLFQNAKGSQIHIGHELISIRKTENEFKLKFHINDGITKHIFETVADYVVITAGGQSVLDGFNFLAELKHTVVPPVPSLFTFNLQEDEVKSLMGLSVENASVRIHTSPFTFKGPLLITHWGFSGPAILKLSSHAASWLAEKQYKAEIRVNWLSLNEEELRSVLFGMKEKYAATSVINSFPFSFPKRLLLYLFSKAQIPERKKWSEVSHKEINKLIVVLTCDTYTMNGKTTFKEEFVTCGGIELSEIDFTRMESKKCTNLFFAGEILNIDALTGGFNFQSAWSTSYISAKSIRETIGE